MVGRTDTTIDNRCETLVVRRTSDVLEVSGIVYVVQEAGRQCTVRVLEVGSVANLQIVRDRIEMHGTVDGIRRSTMVRLLVDRREERSVRCGHSARSLNAAVVILDTLILFEQAISLSGRCPREADRVCTEHARKARYDANRRSVGTLQCKVVLVMGVKLKRGKDEVANQTVMSHPVELVKVSAKLGLLNRDLRCLCIKLTLNVTGEACRFPHLADIDACRRVLNGSAAEDRSAFGYAKERRVFIRDVRRIRAKRVVIRDLLGSAVDLLQKT
jgi:hypothetical protein